MVLTVNGVVVLLVLPLVKEGFGREDNSTHTCHGNTSSEEQETFPSCEYSLERSDVILIQGVLIRVPFQGVLIAVPFQGVLIRVPLQGVLIKAPISGGPD